MLLLTSSNSFSMVRSAQPAVQSVPRTREFYKSAEVRPCPHEIMLTLPKTPMPRKELVGFINLLDPVVTKPSRHVRKVTVQLTSISSSHIFCYATIISSLTRAQSTLPAIVTS
ncbi:hypothetical protein EVAR_6324_1 [Eumeta japonica]|uniref:Uncharacterized protein n=1 Tax=Eumeta variegata TaxID=151549 RepID=A0A4C1TBJ0_EUMVA|nr:hypothetical protein EVAR_6324_1 [Eumeta japonica]